MATIRKWLEEVDFDFENGNLIWRKSGTPWEERRLWMRIDTSHPELDREFDNGYGGAEAPQIVAWNEETIWQVREYDGSEWLEGSERDPAVLIGTERGM